MTQTPVVALYRKDPLQVGDVATTPVRYAEELGLPWLAHAHHLDVEDRRLKEHDPGLERTLRDSIVIIGGGGLTFDYFRNNIAWVTRLKPRALIWWGAGHNIHLGEGTFLSHGRWEDLTDEELAYPSFLSTDAFDLIGVRDPEYTQFEKPPLRYVPCASVMLGSLKIGRGTDPEHEAVVYVQKSRIPTRSLAFPSLSNATAVEHNVTKVAGIDPRSIPAAGHADRAVRFLATGATVVTNSYHGALWALLLDRSVVVLDGWSSKFHKLPAEVLTVPTSEFERDPDSAIARARAVHIKHADTSNLLESAREANLSFATDVAALLTARNLTPAATPC